VGAVEPVDPVRDPLMRSQNDRMLAGVCGGVAKLLKIDSSLLRVLFLLAVIFFGAGLLPYLYAWIVLPKDNAIG
jgi:phage shock protein C